MKTHLFVCSGKLLFLILALGLSSCSDPKKAALRTLAKSRYAFTTDGYFAAAAAGDTESVRLFHELGMEVDAQDDGRDTALIRAAGSGRKQVVEQLLSFGSDPHTENAAGRNALISASAKGYEDIARLLISRGADIEAKDSEGWSALSIAAYNGHDNMVEVLAGQTSEENLNESLLLASFSGDVGVLGHLLGQGAYINVRSPEGQTPLMIASEQGKEDAVRVLLQNQANPYSLDNDGKTAANLAENSGHTKLSAMILDRDQWGRSESGEEIKEEMDSARLAFAAGGQQEILKEDAPNKAASEQSDQQETSGMVAEASNQGRNNISSENTENTDPAAVAVTPPSNAGSQGGRASQDPPVKVSKNTSLLVRNQNRNDQIINQSKSKPMVALNGSRIITRTPGQAVIGSMVLAGFREQPLPIALNDVNDGQAGIRRLGKASAEETVRVKEGKLIPGTGFLLKKVSKRFVSSKEGKGKMVDASRATVEDTKTGSTYTLVRDAEGYSSDKYAVLTSSGSDYRYVVRTGDVFQTVEPGVGKVDHQVLDIRPGAVVIKNLGTDEVRTINRNGTLGPDQPARR